MNKYYLDKVRYSRLARQAVTEGCVLLENRNQALPLNEGERIALFGRSAFYYYKSGLGSGGLVNTGKVDTIQEALSQKQLLLDEELIEIYQTWLEKNPYDEGKGWGCVPWSQKEMPVTEEMLDHAAQADAAVIIIGRTAGEDQDNKNEPGAYLLSETEEELIQKVCNASKRTIVVLNVGNIIDMSWVEKYHPQAVLYVWQGGQEGSHGVADILCADAVPSGRLTDTIAYSIEDYPSTPYFGDEFENEYREDIYVGYRYFETFAQDKVQYPFGYGLSYSTFETKSAIKSTSSEPGSKNAFCVEGTVKNTGDYEGKESVLIYAELPQGKLGNPARRLVGFTKTLLLKPREAVSYMVSVPLRELAVYDDSGLTGHKSAWVLEAGSYKIYAGGDVRSAEQIGTWEAEQDQVLEQLEEACAPVKPYKRMKAVKQQGEGYSAAWEDVPLRRIDPEQRRRESLPKEIPYTGDQGYRLVDVLDGKISMDTFVAQLDDKDLMAIFRGEGMCSTKVTAGTAAAFGGITEKLQKFGIPAGCCADGPSGIRMDCGTKAFSLPNGTLLGCSYNLELTEELYQMLGWEMRLNKIDSLLGPGINIHRNPLNGRNFEYISEDPFLTGKMAAAQIRGMSKYGIGSTIKHFCANNQEFSRHTVNAVVSERALREIYLKGFEMAVKEGQARSVMTTYGPLNGLWTASSYDLCTTILRKEWGYEGIVMTDWWAKGNYEGQDGSRESKASIAAAQNDLYMVTADAEESLKEDDMIEQFSRGYLKKAELQRNAKNILGFLLKSPAILHMEHRICEEELEAMNDKEEDDILGTNITYFQADEQGRILISGESLCPKAGNSDVFGLELPGMGDYEISFTMKSELGELAQLPITVYMNNLMRCQISIQGTEGRWIQETREIKYVFGSTNYLKIYYGANGLDIKSVEIVKKAEE